MGQRDATMKSQNWKVTGIAAALLGSLVVVGILVLLVVAIAVGEEQTHERRHDVVSA